MRVLSFLFFGCALVVGCASPSPPKKPSPYRYAINTPAFALGADRKELP